MKKLLLFFPLLSLFVACEGPAGRDGFDGRDGLNGLDGFSNWEVHEVTVNASDWVLKGTSDAVGSYYTYDIDDVNIAPDAFMADSGLVTVYYKYKEDRNDKWIYSTMPYVNYLDSYSEKYDYEYMDGSIRIYMTRSDFKTSNIPPVSYFKVVYNW